MRRTISLSEFDSMMFVIRPKGWLALAALSCFVIAVLLWSVIFTVPITVTGQGILLSSDGILLMVSTSQGPLLSYEVKVGERVHVGQVVATVDQPELSQGLKDALMEYKQLHVTRNTMVELQRRSYSLKERLDSARRKDLENSLARLREQLSLLKQQVQSQEVLLKSQWINRKTVLETQVEMSRVEQAMESTNNELRRIEIEQDAERIRSEHEMLDLNGRIETTRIKIQALRLRLVRETRVRSPYTGTVMEFFASVGEMVNRASPLFSVIPQKVHEGIKKPGLVAIIYVAPADGKKVATGMSTQVVPVIVKRTEYGGMLGQVLSVADMPSSEEGMLYTLKNKALIHSLSGGASPYEVRVHLTPDPDNITGYRWTSRPPEIVISPGTLCMADIIVRYIHPITLLIPALKPYLPDIVAGA